jgi:hypothetical protein
MDEGLERSVCCACQAKKLEENGVVGGHRREEVSEEPEVTLERLTASIEALKARLAAIRS